VTTPNCFLFLCASLIVVVQCQEDKDALWASRFRMHQPRPTVRQMLLGGWMTVANGVSGALCPTRTHARNNDRCFRSCSVVRLARGSASRAHMSSQGIISEWIKSSWLRTDAHLSRYLPTHSLADIRTYLPTLEFS
jgi:hypothetical protein